MEMIRMLPDGNNTTSVEIEEVETELLSKKMNKTYPEIDAPPTYGNPRVLYSPPPPVKMGSPIAVIIVSSIGLIAIVIGITAGLLWSAIFNRILLHELILTPTSRSFAMWKETPIPMYLEIHLFNWTNPEDFVVGSAVKPNFVEMGPYTFKEVDTKENVVWNPENGTVTFQQRRVWHFIDSMSNGSLSDKVTNLNPVATTVAYMMRYGNTLTKILVNSAIKLAKEKLTVTKTVRELLFDGYNDKLLTMAALLNRTSMPYKKFGWFFNRNQSDIYDGTFNMMTGSTDIKDLGIVQEWNYSGRSKFYKDSCSIINGTLGDLWPPGNDETVSVFAPDVCTSMSLSFDQITEYEGLSGRQYISTREMLDNGTNVPARACYCKNVECQPSGAFNVSSCKFGAPAFMSLPHFYLADESYRSAISGMNPRKEKHQFSMVVEPNAGIPMQVRAKLQLNLLVEPYPGITLFQDVPKTFIPMLWFKQTANLSSDIASQVKFVLVLPMLGHVTFYGIAAIGLLLMSIGAGLYIRRRRKAEDAQHLISNGAERIG